ncbi:unnamed protein product [Kluyveromyces dobzhanskii CBS 2104]|uniref:WGS project CCBQ000000000 data, contig MAT n=1 Tax=Kluyveromyces dobzhanskii CBS 2104 TaxID=1427455 RepID=A0A0A8L0X0_9SACH|nr:unnamed protein product [Kluyveromyces dobzhanskii CBS 2104]
MEVLYSEDCHNREVSKNTEEVLTRLRSYLDNPITDTVLKEIEHINDSIMKSESILKMLVIENGGEYPIFSYLHSIEEKSPEFSVNVSPSIMQDIILKTVSSRFEFNKIWLPKYFQTVPKSFRTGIIFEEQFLKSVLNHINDDMFLLFLNVCCSALQTLENHHIVALLKILVESSVGRGFDAICGVIYDFFYGNPSVITEICKEIEEAHLQDMFCFLGKLISEDDRFIPLFFLEECAAPVPNLKNLSFLQDLLLDLDIASIPFPFDSKNLRSDTWYKVQESGMFHLVFRNLTSGCTLQIKEAAYAVLNKTLRFTSGKLVSLWDVDFHQTLSQLVITSDLNSVEKKYIGLVFALMKLHAAVSGFFYSIETIKQ